MRENTDYLKGVYLMMSVFVIFGCPLFVNIMILVLDNDDYRKVLITPTLLQDDQYDVIIANLIISAIQTLFAFMFFFNPLAVGSFVKKIGQRTGEIITYVSAVLAFMVIPIINILYTTIRWVELGG